MGSGKSRSLFLCKINGLVMQRDFLFKYISGRESGPGFIIAVKCGQWALASWLGYGKPVWWKPRFTWVGFGWLILCFKVQIIELER